MTYKPTIIHHDDLWYSVILQPKGSHWIDFGIYRIQSFDQDNVRSYERKGAKSSDDRTDNILESKPDIDGYIKWDGCSEWTAYEHHCEREHVVNMCKVIVMTFDAATKILEALESGE